MKLEILRKAFEHMWWADERVGTTLESQDSAGEDAVELFAHILAAEALWLDRLEGVPQSIEVWPSADMGASQKLRLSAKLRYADFLDGLIDSDLDRTISYTNSAGKSFQTPIGDILLHVALHGAYHRGQIALLVRQQGATPVPTDYIAMARGTPAATRDPADSNL